MCPRGMVSAYRGCLPMGGEVVSLGGVSEADTPPMNRITDVCENITFPQLLLRTVITLKSMRSHEIQKIPHRAVKFLASEENRIVGKSFP